jgi:hypothetical protein
LAVNNLMFWCFCRGVRGLGGGCMGVGWGDCIRRVVKVWKLLKMGDTGYQLPE